MNKEELLGLEVEQIGIPSRIVVPFNRHKGRPYRTQLTVGELITASDREISGLTGVGTYTLNVVRGVLAVHGLALGTAPNNGATNGLSDSIDSLTAIMETVSAQLDDLILQLDPLSSEVDKKP